MSRQISRWAVGLMALTLCMSICPGATSATVSPLPQPSRDPLAPLSERSLDNLTAFSRLICYVRYFHPADQAAQTDWHRFATTGMRTVAGAADAAELARVLGRLFAPVAPTVQVFVGKVPPPLPAALVLPHGTVPLVVHWFHTGPGGWLSSPFTSERIFMALEGGRVPAGFPAPERPFAAFLPGGVNCRVPLALYAAGKGTLPLAPESAAAAEQAKPIANDRAVRLAAVALAWGALAQFYPYFDRTEVNWPRALRATLARVAAAADDRACLASLRAMLAQVGDGQGQVNWRAAPPVALPPIACDWIEGRLVITAVAPEAAKLIRTGEEVLTLDGEKAEVALAREMALSPAATAQGKRARALATLFLGARGTPAALSVAFPGQAPRAVLLGREVDPRVGVTTSLPPALARPRPGIAYVDPSRLTPQDLQAAVPLLEQANGLVIDLRRAPSAMAMRALLGHLLERPVPSPRWLLPLVSLPDRRDPPLRYAGGVIKPLAPRLTAKVAFLAGPASVGAAEAWLSVAVYAGLGAIVGDTTAGSTGPLVTMPLPGSYELTWTVMKVLAPDGAVQHGVGIAPTVRVVRTRLAAIQGRDEVLERALQEVGGAYPTPMHRGTPTPPRIPTAEQNVQARW